MVAVAVGLRIFKSLCRFLGEPVPDAPFPRTNSTAEFQEIRRKMAGG